MKLIKHTQARLCMVVAIAALALAASVSIAAAAGVEPPSYSNTMEPGASVTIKKTVHTPAIPSNPDIVFLSDTSGSMEAALTNVQSNVTSIMKTVNEDQPSGAMAEFAAADYKDGRSMSEEPGGGCESDPYAFRLGQALTTSLPAVETAINAWSPASGGCDAEESQVNALYQLATTGVGFRTNSDRIVVWTGDAAGHDPDLGHTLNEAIAALVAAKIKVIAVPVKTNEAGLDSTGQATKVAEATGGEVLPEATPAEVSAKILEGLENLKVTVTPTPKCDPGLTATYDAASKTVTSGEDAIFEETLAVQPSASEGGVLKCSVDFLLNGTSEEGFQQSVAITVPLQPTDLSLKKFVYPYSVAAGHKATYTLKVKNHGTKPDANVVITDPLPEGETFVSGDPGCSATANVVTCEIGTLGAGEKAKRSIVVAIDKCAAGYLTNTATVTGERPDSNLSNNSASATLKVKGQAFCKCPPHSDRCCKDRFGHYGDSRSGRCCEHGSDHGRDHGHDHGDEYGRGRKSYR